MKSLLKNIFINTFIIYLLSAYIEGLSVDGGFEVYFITAALITTISIFIDPLLKFILLPFTILTLGLFSFLSTLIALFITTVIYSPLNISEFTFEGFSFYGVVAQKIFLSTLLSFVFISATIYFLNRLINWLFRS